MLPWIERCVLSLRVGSIGVAIPLADVEIDAPWFGHHLQPADRGRPAFLLSAPALVFATAKGNAGFAKLTSLSIQFVNSFDQTKPEHFSGLYHSTQNRLLFPLAEVTIASEKASNHSAKAFSVQARMSGAELDLDANIVNSVFSLVDLYEIGYQRLARHAPDPSFTKTTSGEEPNEKTGMTSDPASFIDTSTFEACFVVDSGIINMHNAKTPALAEMGKAGAPTRHSPRNRRNSKRLHSLDLSNGSLPPRRGTSGSSVPDTFVIPKFSMWATKRESAQKGEISNVHLNVTVHSSRNTLHPTLLPILSAVSEAIKARLHRPLPSPELLKVNVAHSTKVFEDAMASQETSFGYQPSALRNLRITFSLQIDRSRLEISCLQAAQVSAILNWQSGGIIVALQPGIRMCEVAIRVEEVGFELRHTL